MVRRNITGTKLDAEVSFPPTIRRDFFFSNEGFPLVTSKKTQTTKPPPGDDPGSGPKLTVSLFGLFKVDGHGALGVQAASLIALVFWGLVIFKMVMTLFGR